MHRFIFSDICPPKMFCKMFISIQWSRQWSLFISWCTSNWALKSTSPYWFQGKLLFIWTVQPHIRLKVCKYTSCWLRHPLIKSYKDRLPQKEELFFGGCWCLFVCLFVFQPAPSEPALLKTVSIFNVLFTHRSSAGCFSALPVSSLCLLHNPIK